MVIGADDGNSLVEVLLEKRSQDETYDEYRRIESNKTHAVANDGKAYKHQDIVHILPSRERTGKGKNRHAWEDIVTSK